MLCYTRAIMKTTTSTLPDGYERLERALAHAGLASRREAKDLIVRGKVSVNGTVIRETGYGIKLGEDKVEVAGNPIASKESVLIYKPRGIETTKTLASSKDIHDVFPQYAHLSPIGRLDKESEGLIILSNDGTLTKAITGLDSTVSKTYLVSTREAVSDSALKRMTNGIAIDGIMTKHAQTERRSPSSFMITLHEGRKHQIRRMCDALHLTIESLIRVSIGHLQKGSMKAGASKKLAATDITKLKQ